MERRDFRCAYSGLSLLGKEVAVFLTAAAGVARRPIAVPLFGTYEGYGTVESISEGPNADLILAAFAEDLGSGSAQVDFRSLGIAESAPDSIESLVTLCSLAQIHRPEALTWAGEPLGFTLFSAHIAAALMQREAELPEGLDLDEAPDRILGAGLPARIYAPLQTASFRLRCRFGLSFAGAHGLISSMKDARLGFVAPGAGIPEGEASPGLWLAEAIEKHQSDELLVEALEACALSESDESLSEAL